MSFETREEIFVSGDQILKEIEKSVNTLTGTLGEKERNRKNKIDQVAESRSRVALEDTVIDFLQSLQNDTYKKDIENCNELLTALVKDIVPHGNKIEIVLETKGKNPVIDIVSVDDEGRRYDILKDVGGSIKNIVAMGLRAIAICKANLRPILVLDEPDHWVSPSRSTIFFNKVASQLSSDLKFQIFAISHHDATLFKGQNTKILRLDGIKETGVFARVIEKGQDWENDIVPGIRGLTLRNFATYKDSFIPFGPGVTILSGDNDLGKSRVMRAMRAVFFGGNESTDSTIRSGESSTEVTIHIENKWRIIWTRTPKKSPVMHWKMLDENDQVVLYNGIPCSGGGINGGKNPPEWVTDILNIKKMDELDIQLAEQNKSLFILDDNIPAYKKAKILSIGRESSYLDKIISKTATDFKLDKSLINQGEKEVAILNEEIHQMSFIFNIKEKQEYLKELLVFLINQSQQWEKYDIIQDNLQGGYFAKNDLEDIILLEKEIPASFDMQKQLTLLEKIEIKSSLLEKKRSNLFNLSKYLEISSPNHNITLECVDQIYNLIYSLGDKKKNLCNLEKIINIPVIKEIPVLQETSSIENYIKKMEEKENVQHHLSVLNKISIPNVIDLDICYDNIVNVINNLSLKNNRKLSLSKELIEIENELLLITEEVNSIMKDGCPLCGSITKEHKHD